MTTIRSRSVAVSLLTVVVVGTLTGGEYGQPCTDYSDTTGYSRDESEYDHDRYVDE